MASLQIIRRPPSTRSLGMIERTRKGDAKLYVLRAGSRSRSRGPFSNGREVGLGAIDPMTASAAAGSAPHGQPVFVFSDEDS